MTQMSGPGESRNVLVHVDSDIKDIVPVFLGHLREDVPSILRALDAGDYDAVRVMAHSMKGAGGGYGFDRITELGRVMEVAAMDRKAQEIRTLVWDLSSYLDRVEVVYV